jgi:bilin biosynthesis protein
MTASYPTIDPVATDALIDRVTTQITFDTFDPEDHDLLEQLVESFGDTRGLVRLRIASTLGEIGDPATPFLLNALAHHANPVVRRASAKTLTLIADPATVPQLVQALLTDEDTVVKGSAVGALARLGATAVPPLLEILAAPDRPQSMKGHAAWALAFIGAQAQEYLYPALTSDAPEVRSAVVGAIAKVAQEDPKPDLFEILVNALADRDADVRCEAAAALGNLAYQPALPQLTALLQHPDWITRKAGALALMKVGDQSAIVALQTALPQEPEAAVQTVINLAIAQLERQSTTDDWG